MERPRAAHVQSAITTGRGGGAVRQPKRLGAQRGGAEGRPLAPHVLAAMGAVQRSPRGAPSPASSRLLAPHVQAAIGAVQKKATPSPSPSMCPAPHVLAAVGGLRRTIQAPPGSGDLPSFGLQALRPAQPTLAPPSSGAAGGLIQRSLLSSSSSEKVLGGGAVVCSSCGFQNRKGSTMCWSCMQPLEVEEDEEVLELSLSSIALGNAYEAACDIDAVLDEAKIKYAIQGSFAAAMHGAYMPEPPGDVDVLVTNMSASKILVKSGKFKAQKGGSMAVHKLVHVATGTEIDVVFGEEFGILISSETTEIQSGLCVLSLTEVLVSLFLRPERRDKEMIAFASLVLTRGDEVNKVRVSKIAKSKWEAIVENAALAAKHFKIPGLH
jgi:hypothetical protein